MELDRDMSRELKTTKHTNHITHKQIHLNTEDSLLYILIFGLYFISLFCINYENLKSRTLNFCDIFLMIYNCWNNKSLRLVRYASCDLTDTCAYTSLLGIYSCASASIKQLSDSVYLRWLGLASLLLT